MNDCPQVSDVFRQRRLHEVLVQTLPHIARSSFFLAVNGGGFVAFICIVRLVGCGYGLWWQVEIITYSCDPTFFTNVYLETSGHAQ